MITDGNQTKTGQYTSLPVASQGIKNKGVTVYAVGVGKAVDMSELLEIASAPEYVITSPSFKDLQKITLGMRRQFCGGIDFFCHIEFLVLVYTPLVKLIRNQIWKPMEWLIVPDRIHITLLIPPPPTSLNLIIHKKMGGGKMVFKCLGLLGLSKSRKIYYRSRYENYEEKISYLLVNILSTTKIL